MKVGDLVRLKGDDIRGTAHAPPNKAIVPAGTVGIVVPAYHLGGMHRPGRPCVKLCGDGGIRAFLAHDLEVINESG